MDPVCKLSFAVNVRDRTLAMAQRLVPQVTPVLAPDYTPLLLTDGLREYATALVTHYGRWRSPERRQGTGRWPMPRWMSQPWPLSAQVVKAYRRRRIVGIKHRIIFGVAETIESILAKRGWKINTSCVELLNLDLRQPVAAISRRVTTWCKHEAGLRQQLALFHAYHNFVLPHASLRLPLPALAAGLIDRVWNVREGLMCRVPPWPQPQMV